MNTWQAVGNRSRTWTSSWTREVPVAVKIRRWESMLIPVVLERTPQEVPSAVIALFRAHRAGRRAPGSKTFTCRRQDSGCILHAGVFEREESLSGRSPPGDSSANAALRA
ncbi:hypothetical protein [Streptomyces sp. NPDC005476]|uniref:hypothetical protein n=1 Tax=Streptomyces sp. NPDC005476 TaxID=3156882 RepID=UPI00345539CF